MRLLRSYIFTTGLIPCHVSTGYRSLLEEVNVRSNIALGQKRFVNEAGDGADSEESEREFLAMSAQVVGWILTRFVLLENLKQRVSQILRFSSHT